MFINMFKNEVFKDGERQFPTYVYVVYLGAIYGCLKGEFIAALRKGHNQPTTNMAVRDMTIYDNSRYGSSRYGSSRL